jgi:hypothetical protein
VPILFFWTLRRSAADRRELYETHGAAKHGLKPTNVIWYSYQHSFRQLFPSYRAPARLAPTRQEMSLSEA